MPRKSLPIGAENFPDAEPSSAPLPVRVTASKIGRTLLDSMRQADGLPPRQLATGLRVSLAETLSRCRAAAALEVPWQWDGGEARLACASDLAWSAMLGARVDSLDMTDCPRRERVRMALLRLEAKSWVRAEALRRERIGDIDGERTAGTVLGEMFITDGTPPGLPLWAARATAERLCDALRVPTAYTLLFDALRDGTGEDCAADLDVSHAAYRKSCERGRKAVRARYPTHSALIAALSLDDDPNAGGTRSARTRRPPNWRTDTALADAMLRCYSDTALHAAPNAERGDDERAYIARRADYRLSVQRGDNLNVGTRAAKNNELRR